MNNARCIGVVAFQHAKLRDVLEVIEDKPNMITSWKLNASGEETYTARLIYLLSEVYNSVTEMDMQTLQPEQANQLTEMIPVCARAGQKIGFEIHDIYGGEERFQLISQLAEERPEKPAIDSKTAPSSQDLCY